MRNAILGVSLVAAAAAAPAHAGSRLTWLATYEDAVGFERARDVALSPDGRFAYVAASGDDAITVLRRDAASGVLTTDAVVRVGIDGVKGIEAVGELAVPPDGTRLYARGFENGHSTLVVFARDAATGALSFVEHTYVAAPPGDGPSMAVSPDGASLYVLEGHAIAIFAPNVSGGLAHVAEMRDGDQDGAVDGLREVRAIAVSPDGRHVYTAAAGEYGNPTYGDQIVAPFRRDPATGLLTLARSLTLDERRQHPGGFDRAAITPDGAHVYAVQLTDPRRLVTYRRDPMTGLLDERGALELPVSDPGRPGLRVSPDGAFVYVTAPASTPDGPRITLLTFARDAMTGALSAVGATATDAVDAGTPAITADGRHVYLPAAALPGQTPPGAVVLFVRDPEPGALRREGAQGHPTGLEGLDAVSRVATTADGRHVYALSPTEGAVVLFARAEDGSLASLGRLPGVNAHDASELTPSPDGRHVYLLRSDGVEVTARDADGGGLTVLGRTPIALREYEALSSPVMSPDGRFLYVLRGRYDETTIIALRRDPDRGTLTVAARRRFGTEPRAISSMAIGPRGRAIYVGGTFVESHGYREQVTAVLRAVPRDRRSGALGRSTRVWSRRAADYRGAAVVDLVPSPDGRHLYANAPHQRLAVFALRARPPSRRGALSGEPQPTDLHDLALTSDGAHAAGLTGSWLYVFARDAASGRLSVADFVGDADGGPFLRDASDLALSPDGRQVYAASPARDAITAFALDAD